MSALVSSYVLMLDHMSLLHFRGLKVAALWGYKIEGLPGFWKGLGKFLTFGFWVWGAWFRV